VKQGGGKPQHLITEVEIVCLPKHLPEFLDIDVSELELDDMLKLSDIQLPEGVSIPALAQGEEADRGVVSIHIIKEVVIEEEEELEPGAVPVGGEEVEGEEGEAAEGEEPTGDDSEKE
jgi:large subunit ribosomal protein L25